MATRPRPKADPDMPKHLRDAGRALWLGVRRDFTLTDAAALALLQVAAEARDRAGSARERIDADGPLLLDRFGKVKPHPLLGIERDSRAAVVAALRALGVADAGG
jgi:hypothetical protein